MPTFYEPYDGDYTDGNYTALLNAMQTEQGFELGVYLEICVSLTEDDQLYILCSNDDGNEWVFDYIVPIPAGWDLKTVREMFPGNVYLKCEEE